MGSAHRLPLEQANYRPIRRGLGLLVAILAISVHLSLSSNRWRNCAKKLRRGSDLSSHDYHRINHYGRDVRLNGGLHVDAQQKDNQLLGRARLGKYDHEKHQTASQTTVEHQ
jgi:hypothetical protein